MNNITEFYTTEIKENRGTLTRMNRKLFFSSMIRLFVFFAIIFLIYLSFGNTQLVVALMLLGVVSFVFLVVRHSNLQYQRDIIAALITINETEIQVHNRNYFHLPEGNEYKDPSHYYSHDIDLFGRGSFYQYMNRTSLESGSKALANLLTENTIISIPKRQEAIKELSAMPKWRQRFSAIATLVKTDVDAGTVVNWLKKYEAFVPLKVTIGAHAFSLISGLLLVLFFTSLVSGYVVFGWFLLGLTITGRFLKQINELSMHTSKIQSTFRQFHKLLFEIEKEEFASDLLSEKRSKIINDAQSASSILKKFAKHLDDLDQRQNMLVGVLANGFMLRDLAISGKIENWIKNHEVDVAAWFEVISFFDAYNSLGNYTFNHPSNTFPSITNDGNILKSEDIGHPLLDPAVSIRNDFNIASEQFFIVTGANMAGKSTFLRTVALQIVMANMGLPVIASEANYRPIKLISSMRTSDSLADDESYFFSELKRLKYIVEEIEQDTYFIILDEILKGTNSTDKAIGSRKFIEKLVTSHSTGIIATHDLSLCAAADDFSEIENHYFDARIENNELYFDYLFKPGVCQNMNASFLLKKMKIVD